MRASRHSTSQPLRRDFAESLHRWITSRPRCQHIWAPHPKPTVPGLGLTPIRTSRANQWLPAATARPNRLPIWNDGRIHVPWSKPFTKGSKHLGRLRGQLRARRTSRLSGAPGLGHQPVPDGSLNTQLWDEQRLTTWFDTFMPTLDLNPEVYQTMTDRPCGGWLQHRTASGTMLQSTSEGILENAAQRCAANSTAPVSNWQTYGHRS